MTRDEPLLVDVGPDGVARLIFNRPQLRNALDAAQWENLASALSELAANPAVRCLVVSGRDGAFVSGGDLKTLIAELDTENGPAAFRDRIHRSLRALYSFPVPTIAMVNGAAIGGGLELAVACDVRIASDTARFGMPAARFGMVMAAPEFARLASIVGTDRARFLAITGHIIDGEESLRIGLVHQLVPADALEAATEQWASRLLSMEPRAVAWFRRAASMLEARGDLDSLRDFEEECLTRAEFRRRVEEFLRK